MGKKGKRYTEISSSTDSQNLYGIDEAVKLVKNNMLKMALKDSQFASMSENVSGPQIVAVGKEDAGKFAKSIKEFIDKHENLKPKAIN